MRTAQIAPYAIREDGPQPFIGAWLKSNGGSVYRMLVVHELPRVARAPHVRRYRLLVECHGKDAPITDDTPVFTLRWSPRKKRARVPA